MLAGSSALSRWAVAELAPFLLLVRGRQLAFGRKKENQPAEQKGHTTDYHRNANRIHVESSKEYRSGSFEDPQRSNSKLPPVHSGGAFSCLMSPQAMMIFNHSAQSPVAPF
jgi:hypothetical protein